MNRDSHHESTTRVYRLEVRLDTHIPGDSRSVGGEMATREWREITSYGFRSGVFEYVEFHQALAFAHAMLASERYVSLQFRLVAYDIKTRVERKYRGIVDMPLIECGEFPAPGVLPEPSNTEVLL